MLQLNDISVTFNEGTPDEKRLCSGLTCNWKKGTLLPLLAVTVQGNQR